MKLLLFFLILLVAFFFGFGFILDVLIVVYTPRVYWIVEVKDKLTFTCFSLWTNYFFVVESIHAFYFSSNVVVSKALLV